MNARQHGSCGVDLDALAYGELGGEAELTARFHLTHCQRCAAQHGALMVERRRFAERAGRAPAGLPNGTPSEQPLPDFDALLARAASRPPGLMLRWRLALGRLSAGSRNGLAASLVGGLAMLAVLGVGRPQTTIAPERAQLQHPSAVEDGAARATSFEPLPTCDGAEVCVDQPIAYACTQSLLPGGESNAGAASPGSFVSIDWSSQRSSPTDLDVLADAVCVPDAI